MSSKSATPQMIPLRSAVSNLISASGAKTASEALALEILHNLQYQHSWTELKLHVIYLNTKAQFNSHTGGSNGGAGSGGGGGGGDGGGDDISTLVTVDPQTYFTTPHPPRSPSSSTSSSPSHSGQSTPTSASSETVHLISGLPPRHSYIHPDLQMHLVKHSIAESSLSVQREFVLPTVLGEKWSLARFCGVFDTLPLRDPIVVVSGDVTGEGDGEDVHPNGGERGNLAGPSRAAGRRGNLNGNGNATLSSRGRGAAGGRGHGILHQHQDQKRVLLGMKARTGGGGDGTVVYYIMQEGEVKPRQNG